MCAPECQICLDIYGINVNHIKAPKFLSCGHSICKECLEGIIRKSTENFILCPFCKEEIEKKQNVNNYITNKQLIQLVNEAFGLPKEESDNLEINKKSNIFNIISLGSSSIGKTSILYRLLNEKFEDDYKATTPSDKTFPYFVKYKGQKYQLFFYDTCGQERFMQILPKNYLRKSDGVFFVFDLGNKDSFNDLKNWYELYKNEKGEENVVGVLLGNKCDELSKIDYEEIKKFADEHNLEYLETSSKLDKKIKKAIAVLLEQMIESKALYNSLRSINTKDETIIKLSPKEFEIESIFKSLC